MKCAHIHVHCDSVQQKFVLQLAAFTQLENNECFPKPSPLKCLPLNHKCLTNFRHRRFIEHWDTHLMRGIEGTNVLVIAPLGVVLAAMWNMEYRGVQCLVRG